jgi:hypothetical protein
MRARGRTAQALAAGAGSGVRTVKREIDEPLNAGLPLAAHVAATASQYIAEHFAKIG